MSSLLPLAEALNPAPWLAFAAVAIVGLRLNGLLSDEVISDLNQPFSKSTLTVVALVVMVWQVTWLASQF